MAMLLFEVFGILSPGWNHSYLGRGAVQGGIHPFGPHPLCDVCAVGRGGAAL